MSRHPFRNSLLCVLLSLIVVLLAATARADESDEQSHSRSGVGFDSNTTHH